jgi:hypothetical protein
VFAFHSRITDNLTRLPAFNGPFGSELALPISTIACFRGAGICCYGQLLSKANASADEKFQLLNIRQRSMFESIDREER